jgi:hypothetical protein
MFFCQSATANVSQNVSGVRDFGEVVVISQKH